MPRKKATKLRYTFEFDYTVTTHGVPQPYPVRPPNSSLLFRLSPAEDQDGQKFLVMNVCGNREGLEYLAAMLALTANSEKYDPEFHIHLERMVGVKTDMDVTIRAPAYFDVLKRGEFSEFKGTLKIPPERKRRGS